MTQQDSLGDFARRTIRWWALVQVPYALAILAAVALFLPWKTPAYNIALISYALLHLISAPGLWSLKKWGWSIALIAGIIGFASALLITTGLVASWAYLRAIWGDFGLGASIGALLFASVAIQVLGLYPALLVRALSRREVRAYWGSEKKKPWTKALVASLCLPLLVGVYVDQRYQMETLDPVSPQGREQAIQYLRQAIDQQPPTSLRALRATPTGEGPLVISVWLDGEVQKRVHVYGDTMASSLRIAGESLREWAQQEQIPPGQGRIKIDRISGVAPIISEHPSIVALSVDPGRDGLRRGLYQMVLPDDLVQAQLFGKTALVPGIKELRLGLDTQSALDFIADSDLPLERFRTESWIEFEGHSLAISRGNTLDHHSGPLAWREAAIAGGDFVLRQINPDGRFHYKYFPTKDQHSPINKGYSIPRHAGTVYALALLFEHTGEERFRRGAEQAISWLNKQKLDNCGAAQRACILENNAASLGSAALSLVGMLEYQRATQDQRYQDSIIALLEFLLFMQQEHGDSYHTYFPKEDRIDRQVRSMFYTEESALALIMAYKVLGDERYLEAAERALDFLTGPKYEDFFLGNFVFGADHWTCIAAEEAWPHLDDPSYLDFCLDYSSFFRKLQYEADAWPPGYQGHYGFGTLMVPQAPATAGFSEAIISTWLLAEHHGVEEAALTEQLDLGLDALSRDQIRPANAWLMPNPEAARGGIRRSLVEYEIRIDFTQHALSALIRGAEARATAEE